MALLSRSSSQTAEAINNLLEQRDVIGLLTIAAGAAGGVVLTQRLANRVLPLIGMSPTPTSVTGGLASSVTKGTVGAAFMYGATQTTGLGKVLLAFLSLGSLTSAGFDILGLFVDVPSLASPKGGRRTSASASANPTATVSASATNTSNSSQSTATDGGFSDNQATADAF